MNNEVSMVLFARQNRWLEEIDLEVKERHRTVDRELFIDLEEPEVDLQECEEAREDFARNVEYRQWREQLFGIGRSLQLIRDVQQNLVEPNLHVVVRVKQVELDRE